MTNEINTPHLILKFLAFEDVTAIELFETENTHHLSKWETPPTQSVQQRVKGWLKDGDEGRSVRFSIRSKENPDRIIGFCNFTQIFRGGFQACYLGYKMDHRYEGRGWMFEALQAAIPYIFETVGLHRIMANYMPINVRSAALLKRLGFRIEGFAKNYLQINGNWEDHVLTGLSKEEWLTKLAR